MNDLTLLTPEERETINEDFPWALDYIDELNAEIERLVRNRNGIREMLEKANAEIERLRRDYSEQRFLVKKYWDEGLLKDKLIIELTDALEDRLDLPPKG